MYFLCLQSQFYKFLLIGAAMLIGPLMYIKYYQQDPLIAVSHLGQYCVCLTVIGYGAPLVSLVSDQQFSSFVLMLS